MTLPYRICSHKECRAHASFGIGVALLKGRPGTWFCMAHVPAPPIGPDLGRAP